MLKVLDNIFELINRRPDGRCPKHSRRADKRVAVRGDMVAEVDEEEAQLATLVEGADFYMGSRW